MDTLYRLSVGDSFKGGVHSHQRMTQALTAGLGLFGFEGATIRWVEGFWLGVREGTLEVDIVAGKGDGRRVRRLALYLAETLWQECVLVTEQPVTAWFVRPGDTKEDTDGNA